MEGETETDRYRWKWKNCQGSVKVDLVLVRRTLVLFLLSFRKLQDNQDLISCRLSERSVGWRLEVGLVDR